MAQHRADDTYIPLKTITVVAWFFGLFTVIVVGMSTGDKFSVFPTPLFGPFPAAQSVMPWEVLVPQLIDTTPKAETTTPEAVPTAVPSISEAAVISVVSEAPTVARQPAVRASEPVRTPERVSPSPSLTSAPVADQPVISTPDPVVETPVVTTPPVVTEEPVVEEPVVTDIPTPTTPEETVSEETATPEATATPTE